MAVLAIPVCAGGLWAVQRPAPVEYDTVPVIRRDLEVALTASGRILPVSDVDVGAQVSGRLETLHVAVGDHVTQGQLLVEIDAEVQAAQVEGLEAGIAGLVAERTELETLLAFSERQVSRKTTLAGRVSAAVALEEAERERDILRAQIDGKDAALRRSRAELRAERAALAHTRITAPMTGTVTMLDARVGQTLNANYDTPVLLRIADLSVMTVRAEVSEADVVHLSPGMPPWFTTLGRPDQKYDATLRQILPAPPEPKEGEEKTSGNVVNYIALFDVENPDGALMSGMTAQVFFVTARATDVPSVPLAALDAESTLRIVGPNGVETRRPEFGMRTRSHAEIIGGLAENEQVISAERVGQAPRLLSIVP